MAKVMLGELLVRAGLVGEAQVLSAVRGQRGSGLPLGHYLVKTGVLTEDELVRVLSQQLEVPIVDLDSITPHTDALQKVNENYARTNLVMPFRLEGRVLYVATADATREDILDHLRVTTFCDARFSLATLSALDRALERAYGPGVATRPAASTGVWEAVQLPGRAKAAPPPAAAAPVGSAEQRIAALERTVAAVVKLLVSNELASEEDLGSVGTSS
jgi:hypothetical protein